MTYQATYSPDDNKLRLYSTTRLSSEDYAAVKAAGFRYAPKQELFYAIWSPRAEDLMIEMVGEIGDEDKTLVDRAAERAERFETYSDKRANEADRAKKAVSELANNIPFGQPILVGHHSERRARRDAEKIENGMRKAVKLWETSEYWTQRAAGAIAHAKYKELPAVRARRIKGLEADLRRVTKEQDAAKAALKFWSNESLTLEKARVGAGYGLYGFTFERREGGYFITALDVLRPDNERYASHPAYTLEQVVTKAKEAFPKRAARAQRWIDHYQNRLAYEKAMLAEQGQAHLLDKKPRPKQLPLLNYRAEGGTITVKNRFHKGQLDVMEQIEMTQAEYAAIYTDYKETAEVDGTHRVRMCMRQHRRVAVFITDSKTHEKPSQDRAEAVGKVVEAFAEQTAKEIEAAQIDQMLHGQSIVRVMDDGKVKRIDPRAEEFRALKERAKQGVEVVSAPNLFVTPTELAARVIEQADIQPSHSVLEPSAGTGNLLGMIPRPANVTAVEINHSLAQRLQPMADRVICEDFLQLTPEAWGTFDRIVMNPPFAGQADIDHVVHALKFLKPNGKLVAIMSAGVNFRQDRKAKTFRDLVEKHGGTIEELPAESFKLSGTNVSTVLVEIPN